MKVTANTEAVAVSLRKAQELVQRRLKYMVREFAAEVANKASENTPVVSPENIAPGGKMRSLYEQRLDDYGIPIEQGFHAGSWQYTEGSLVFNPSVFSQEEVQGMAQQDVKANYKLGDTFMIGAIGPAIQKLENGLSPRAPDGIMKPTLNAIMSAFAVDMRRYYNQINK